MPGEVGAGSFWKYMTDYVSGAIDLDTALRELTLPGPNNLSIYPFRSSNRISN
jgi:alpha-glucoside transport system substrate-binding protein